MEKVYTSLKEVQQDISENKLSCTELVQSYLDRIEENKHLNVFLEVFDKEALQVAVEVDEKIINGSAGKLAGMVIAIKDNICYKGHKVSASSKILEGFEGATSYRDNNQLVKQIVLMRDEAIEPLLTLLNSDKHSGNDWSKNWPVTNAITESLEKLLKNILITH